MTGAESHRHYGSHPAGSGRPDDAKRRAERRRQHIDNNIADMLTAVSLIEADLVHDFATVDLLREGITDERIQEGLLRTGELLVADQALTSGQSIADILGPLRKQIIDVGTR